MTDLEIAAIATGIALIVGSLGLIAYVVLVSRGKRRRMAAVYEPSGEPPQRAPAPFAARVWPPRPATVKPRPFTAVPLPEAPVPDDRDTPVEPRYGYMPRHGVRERGPFTRPTAPADPSPVLFGDPVSLSSTTFEGHAERPEGHGGAFGGAGASGGWDGSPVDPSPLLDDSPSPSFSDSGGSYSGDTGGGSDSSSGSSND